jgi:predicted dehydrogenase
MASPNNTRFDITLAAAKAGKMVFSKKPLAMNSAEALEMTEAVEKAGLGASFTPGQSISKTGPSALRAPRRPDVQTA